MIEVRGLTKRYGRVLAVDALSFGVRPGSVTGFLGPNGSGKSTTMRMILGLDHPDRGSAVIGGRRYGELGWPLREGRRRRSAGRTGSRRRSWLGSASATNSASSFVASQGVLAALGRAPAGATDLLLSEPGDELDSSAAVSAGIGTVRPWIRTLMRSLAAEGRTVFVSSHLISEMALTADRLIVIGGGRLLADTTVAELSTGSASLEDAFLELTSGTADYRAKDRAEVRNENRASGRTS